MIKHLGGEQRNNSLLLLASIVKIQAPCHR